MVAVVTCDAAGGLLVGGTWEGAEGELWAGQTIGIQGGREALLRMGLQL